VCCCFGLFFQLKRKNIWTTDGAGDITSFYMLKTRHELAVNGLNSKITLVKFCDTQIEHSLNLAYKINCEEHNDKVRANGYIVCCLMDAICYLAQQELPFRGHLQNTESEKRLSYLEYFHCRAQHDEKFVSILKLHQFLLTPIMTSEGPHSFQL
jgi:hypothetical protein